jgi:hypothetical protein
MIERASAPGKQADRPLPSSSVLPQCAPKTQCSDENDQHCGGTVAGDAQRIVARP